jgi:hypothetical protein
MLRQGAILVESRRSVMVRRLLLALTLGTLTTGVLVPVAAAAAPERFTETFEGTFFAPAGELCDFDYSQVFSGTDVVTIFGDRVQVQETLTVTHTNVDADYTLTENDRLFFAFGEESEKDVGVFWHLRDASGKLVVVQAGQLRFDETGLIKFTPNLNPDFAAVICPALGGNPA